jgi:Mg/Co/Ni transporter MgtE
LRRNGQCGQTGEVCTALVDATGTICGFVTILDIVQFITEQLKTEFTVQIDFSAQDVARQSVHGRQHLQQAWAVAEQHKVNMAADVLRARCLKLTQPPSAAIHTTPVSALICGRREVLQMRPGFTVSDVCRHLAEATSHRVPLVDWERRPLAVISQVRRPLRPFWRPL